MGAMVVLLMECNWKNTKKTTYTGKMSTPSYMKVHWFIQKLSGSKYKANDNTRNLIKQVKQTKNALSGCNPSVWKWL
jgi:hypothetical protein